MQNVIVKNRTQQLLVVMLVMQGLMLAGQWVGPGVSYVQPAMAQVSDPGAQRIQIIDQLKDVNRNLTKLIDLLNSGDLQVKVNKDDEKK